MPAIAPFEQTSTIAEIYEELYYALIRMGADPQRFETLTPDLISYLESRKAVDRKIFDLIFRSAQRPARPYRYELISYPVDVALRRMVDLNRRCLGQSARFFVELNSVTRPDAVKLYRDSLVGCSGSFIAATDNQSVVLARSVIGFLETYGSIDGIECPVLVSIATLQARGLFELADSGIELAAGRFNEDSPLAGDLDFGIFFDARSREVRALSRGAISQILGSENGIPHLGPGRDISNVANQADADHPSPTHEACVAGIAGVIAVGMAWAVGGITKNEEVGDEVGATLGAAAGAWLGEVLCGGGKEPEPAEPYSDDPHPLPGPAQGGADGGNGQDGDGDDGDHDGGNGDDGDHDGGNTDDDDVDDDGGDPDGGQNGADDDFEGDEAHPVWDRDCGDPTDTPSHGARHQRVLGPQPSLVTRQTPYITPTRADLAGMPRLVDTDAGPLPVLGKMKPWINPITEDAFGNLGSGSADGTGYLPDPGPYINPGHRTAIRLGLGTEEAFRLIGEGLARAIFGGRSRRRT